MAEAVAVKLTEFEVSRIKFLPYNPNRLPPAKLNALDASHERFQRFGPLQNIVVNDRKGPAWPKSERGLYVVGGEHRLRVAARRKLKTYPGLLVSVGPAEEQVMNLALNNHGDYDPAALGKLLEEIEQAKENLEATGISDKEVEEAIKAMKREIGGEVEEDSIPALPDKAKTKPGELVELGPHRLLCADSLEAGTIAGLLGKEKAAALVTDPPYAIYGSASGLSSEITDDKIVRPFFESVLRIAKEHTARSAQVYVFCDWRSWPSWWEMAKRVQLSVLNLLVWDKGGAGLGNNYANAHELVGYFANVTLSGVMTRGQKKGVRAVLKPNVLHYPRVPSAQREHNAAKPVAMLRDFVLAASDEGDLILDPFAGSGSTLIACEKAGRRCFTVEIEPRYCDVVRKRYENLKNEAPG